MQCRKICHAGTLCIWNISFVCRGQFWIVRSLTCCSDGHFGFTRQLELLFCNGWRFNSKDGIYWEGISGGVNSFTVNGVQYLFEVSRVQSLVGKVLYLIDVFQDPIPISLTGSVWASLYRCLIRDIKKHPIIPRVRSVVF